MWFSGAMLSAWIAAMELKSQDNANIFWEGAEKANSMKNNQSFSFSFNNYLQGNEKRMNNK